MITNHAANMYATFLKYKPEQPKKPKGRGLLTPMSVQKKNTSNKQQPIHIAHKFFQQIAEARKGLNVKTTTTT
tara:strand:+ start:424 stop:642 length:219 start_codon:yes stop_codon:yes gene_type:complete